MAGRLESLVHGNRAAMADVSHGLRTPLAALRLRLDVLSQDTDAGTAEEYAGAQDEIARLSRMVDGLLAVARAESVLVDPVGVPAWDEVIRDRAAAWRPLRAYHLSVLAGVRFEHRGGAGYLHRVGHRALLQGGIHTLARIHIDDDIRGSELRKTGLLHRDRVGADFNVEFKISVIIGGGFGLNPRGLIEERHGRFRYGGARRVPYGSQYLGGFKLSEGEGCEQ